LVELLVVIVVIGILAAMVLGALQAARETARTAKTRATISKLHNIVMGMYESYRTRRVPIYSNGVPVNTSAMNPQSAALARLCVLRDLMRMEMPERMTDLADFPLSFTINGVTLGLPATGPALWQAYRNHIGVPSVTLKGNTPAECLYMIVTIGCRARGQFSENEIANDAVDGFPEFVDGWGHPIYFLRWAPGFIDSDIQAPVAVLSGSQYAISSSLALQATQTDHDPFDPMQVDTTNGVSNGPSGWRLVPLIYSAGPDGQYGIAEDTSSGSPYAWNNDTYKQVWGSPVPATPGQRLDNIHNHRLQGDRK
jgi:hypothetical protein